MTDSPTLLSPLLNAKILADSLSGEGVRLTTMELVFPRFVHSELMTHRVFSRNASSSRAIPTKRAIKMMRDTPAVPASWRMNQAGMQGYEVASMEVAMKAQEIWLSAMESAIEHSENMDALGIHKQVVNRIAEPYSHIKVVLTSVYWDNWNTLRNHHAADPTIAALAVAIETAREASTPKPLGLREWHLPYIDGEAIDAIKRYLSDETIAHSDDTINDIAIKVSTARCARVSYNNHDGSKTDIEKDLKLHDMLLKDQPIHASPAEHQAQPDFRINHHGMWANERLHANLHGWRQYRKTLENENMDTDIIGFRKSKNS